MPPGAPLRAVSMKGWGPGLVSLIEARGKGLQLISNKSRNNEKKKYCNQLGKGRAWAGPWQSGAPVGGCKLIGPKRAGRWFQTEAPRMVPRAGVMSRPESHPPTAHILTCVQGREGDTPSGRATPLYPSSLVLQHHAHAQASVHPRGPPADECKTLAAQPTHAHLLFP